jgi:hypothetical protein
MAERHYESAEQIGNVVHIRFSNGSTPLGVTIPISEVVPLMAECANIMRRSHLLSELEPQQIETAVLEAIVHVADHEAFPQQPLPLLPLPRLGHFRLPEVVKENGAVVSSGGGLTRIHLQLETGLQLDLPLSQAAILELAAALTALVS